jgi:hypothetical protein
LGWTEAQTLATSVPAILAAFKGRQAMLRAIFGGSDEQKPVVSDQKLTPQIFDAMFARK